MHRCGDFLFRVLLNFSFIKSPLNPFKNIHGHLILDVRVSKDSRTEHAWLFARIIRRSIVEAEEELDEFLITNLFAIVEHMHNLSESLETSLYFILSRHDINEELVRGMTYSSRFYATWVPFFKIISKHFL